MAAQSSLGPEFSIDTSLIFTDNQKKMAYFYVLVNKKFIGYYSVELQSWWATVAYRFDLVKDGENELKKMNEQCQKYDTPISDEKIRGVIDRWQDSICQYLPSKRNEFREADEKGEKSLFISKKKYVSLSSIVSS